jgi:16S rRNA (uracil1498-N3)-methyltransferase
VKLKAALTVEAGSRLLLNEDENEKKICDALNKMVTPLVFAVGPEGGWADEELTQFSTTGWQSVTLGSTILRAETAAIAAVALASAILDGMEKYV